MQNVADLKDDLIEAQNAFSWWRDKLTCLLDEGGCTKDDLHVCVK